MDLSPWVIKCNEVDGWTETLIPNVEFPKDLGVYRKRFPATVNALGTVEIISQKHTMPLYGHYSMLKEEVLTTDSVKKGIESPLG